MAGGREKAQSEEGRVYSRQTNEALNVPCNSSLIVRVKMECVGIILPCNLWNPQIHGVGWGWKDMERKRI